jgi:branched-chain amino acid transport system substrate-binding protein
MRNGAALAIAEINARGGIAGRPVRQVVVGVDITAGESILRSFEELVSAEVDAITSGYVLVDEEARDLAAAYGAPFLHAMTSQQSVDQVRESPATHGHIFQVCPTEGLYGPTFVQFLTELSTSGRWQPPNRNLAFIDTPAPGGQMANLATMQLAEDSGWNVASCDLVPVSGSTWLPSVEKLHRLNPAAVMIAHFLPDRLAEFQRLFAQESSETLVYAVYAPSIPQFLERAGKAAEGMLWSTVTGTYGDPVGSRFFQRYLSAYGRPPGRSHAGIAYDEVHLLAQAWAQVANPRNFAAVADHLRTSNHRGVNGAYFFDHAGQCGLAYPDVTLDPSLGQAHLVFQVQDGRHRILSPAPYTDGTYRCPEWMPRRAGSHHVTAVRHHERVGPEAKEHE